MDRHFQRIYFLLFFSKTQKRIFKIFMYHLYHLSKKVQKKSAMSFRKNKKINQSKMVRTESRKVFSTFFGPFFILDMSKIKNRGSFGTKNFPSFLPKKFKVSYFLFFYKDIITKYHANYSYKNNISEP